MQLTKEIQEGLSSPFADDEVKWKPKLVEKKDGSEYKRNGQRVAGCLAHIDARSVMNRLDEVVGAGGWSDSYRVLPNGINVECTLTVCGVSKADVGEPNSSGFADKMKGAYSDALKRAAVKFGIGRFLYDMEMEWLAYDGYKIIAAPLSGNKPPKIVGENEHDHKIADLRAVLETAPNPTLGLVADYMVTGGVFKTQQLALKAIERYDFPDGVKITMTQKVSNDGAVKLFDWLVAT